METRRVVISSLGHCLPATVEQRLKQNGVCSSAVPFHCTIEQEKMDQDLRKYMDYGAMRRFDKLTKSALCAALQCMSHSKLSVTNENRNDIGCIFNTIYGPLSVFTAFIHSGLTSPLGLSGASALLFPYTVMSASSGIITKQLRVNGFNTTLTGYNPVCYAYDTIKDQKAKVLLTGGFDELTEELIEAHSPRIACLTEGSAMAMLEDYDHAKKRNAPILFFVEGYGVGTSLQTKVSSVDNYVDVDEETLYRVINSVFSKTSINPRQTGLILSFCNHQRQKETESRVFQRVWNKERSVPQLLYPKEIVGDGFAANEVIVYELLDVYLRQNSDAVHSDTPYILINHFQVGGNITSVIIRKS